MKTSLNSHPCNRWYYLDRSTRGDITAIRNYSGALQATARYSAYGELAWKYETGVTSALTDALSRDYDGAQNVVRLTSGLIWMGARVYSPLESRFVSSDARDADRGSTSAPYNYADGDPIDLSDPSGLDSCSVNFGSFGISKSGYLTWDGSVKCKHRNAGRLVSVWIYDSAYDSACDGSGTAGKPGCKGFISIEWNLAVLWSVKWYFGQQWTASCSHGPYYFVVDRYYTKSGTDIVKRRVISKRPGC